MGPSEAIDHHADSARAARAHSQQHPTQGDGVSTPQESAPPLTQIEGVVFSEAQLPSPIAPQHVRADVSSQQGAGQSAPQHGVVHQQQKPCTPQRLDSIPKRTPGRSGSQKSPILTRARLVPGAETVQNPPGTYTNPVVICSRGLLSSI